MSFKRHPGNLYGVNDYGYDAMRLETQYDTEAGDGYGDGYGTAQQGDMQGDSDRGAISSGSTFGDRVALPYQDDAIQETYEEFQR